MKNLIRLMMCAALALPATPGLAAPPQTINYQGYLTNPGGTPINAPVVMTFRLYNASSGGAALYTETQLSVNVTNGGFNAIIGAVTPIPLPFDVPYWLTVAVNADAEMSPRQPLASSAYAFRAATADAVASSATIAGLQITGSLATATIPLANVVGSGSLGTVTNVNTGAGLSGGPISGTGTISLAATNLLPTSACAATQIAKWSGSAWACAAADGLPAGGVAGQVLAGTAGGPAWTDSPSVSGSLTLPSVSSASAGNVMKGSSSFIHNTGVQNTYLGVSAGNFTTTGASNTAIGTSSLGNNINGSNNTASGAFSLSANTSGGFNTASGDFALTNNLGGNSNTAIGSGALNTNTSGSSNTASGVAALRNNYLGSGNTASGAVALFNSGKSASAGSFVVGVGYVILTSGTTNFTLIGAANSNPGTFFTATGIGSGTGTAAAIASNNTALGYQALQNFVAGATNTAIGYQAGLSLTSGSLNIYIGSGSLGAGVESNTTRIGNGNQTRTFVSGVSGVTTAFAAVPVLVDGNGQLGTISSSRRYKDNVADMNEASSALMNLRPVTFHYKADKNSAGHELQYGLIAEEVNEIYPGLVAHGADGQIETVMYQYLPPMLLNEFQKQQRTIAAQAVRIGELESAISNIEARLNAR